MIHYIVNHAFYSVLLFEIRSPQIHDLMIGMGPLTPPELQRSCMKSHSTNFATVSCSVTTCFPIVGRFIPTFLYAQYHHIIFHAFIDHDSSMAQKCRLLMTPLITCTQNDILFWTLVYRQPRRITTLVAKQSGVVRPRNYNLSFTLSVKRTWADMDISNKK